MSTATSYPSSICRWPVEDRPREKLNKYGEHHLNNSELLAILLRTGVKGQSAVDLARQILSRFKTFRNMSHTDSSDWQGFRGLGEAKIAQIKAAIEIGRRFREDEVRHTAPKIKSSKDVADILMPRMRDLKFEVFKVIYLDASNRIIVVEDHDQGTVHFASPIIREIFKRALQVFAVSLVCVHNHPSGEIQPSREDKSFTRKLTEAGHVMQIKILDHIIIGDNLYYSFADEGALL